MDKPYLALVDLSHDPQADEFLPLPHYPWDERPDHLALDHDECATAIHLAHGSLPRAADLLKVPLHRLSRSVRASPRLRKIQDEGLSLSLEKAKGEVIDALDSPDNKRREWAATKLLQSRFAMGDPLSPAPAASIQSNASLTATQSGATKSLTFRWKTELDLPTTLESDDLSNGD